MVPPRAAWWRRHVSAAELVAWLAEAANPPFLPPPLPSGAAAAASRRRPAENRAARNFGASPLPLAPQARAHVRDCVQCQARAAELAALWGAVASGWRRAPAAAPDEAALRFALRRWRARHPAEAPPEPAVAEEGWRLLAPFFGTRAARTVARGQGALPPESFLRLWLGQNASRALLLQWRGR